MNTAGATAGGTATAGATGRGTRAHPAPQTPQTAQAPQTGGTLVAGVGNVLLGDDGFGVEVVQRLLRGGVPPGVTAADYGISGLQLAFDLCSGYGTVVLVDALGLGHTPGTVSLIDLGGARAPAGFDAHGMRPDAVLDLVATLGGHLDHVLLVGCEPARVDHRIGLSAPVAAAVTPAVSLVRSLVETPEIEPSRKE